MKSFVDKELEPNPDGLTPLMYAIRKGKETWRKLLDVLPDDLLRETFMKVCADEQYKDILVHFLKFSLIRVHNLLYDGLVSCQFHCNTSHMYVLQFLKAG